MVRLQISLELAYEVTAPGSDFIFAFHAAQTRHQRIVEERLNVSQTVPRTLTLDPASGNRVMRLQAMPGTLRVAYDATIDVAHHIALPEQIGEVPVAQLPVHVLPFLLPSRYCESDRLGRFAISEFGTLWQGYGRVQAIRDWVQRHVTFASNTTDGNTSAVDTLTERVGVCRDFAHLMIALCRALSIPARFTTGFDFGADPALGPPDFHAYVEVWLGGRWYLFDPSGTAIPMGLVRLATGRDAADVAFATIFGTVQSQAPVIRLGAETDPVRHMEWPRHRPEALSTDGGALDEVLRAA